ncbi:hypothetical protein QBC38DRAFT_532067 [Podospora fimiseda]|uniref:Uncharacterized protein n=1 Tax=Podospora fimiseda TaxID=252190 RepID=A0AAN7BJP4_9PEZI|nr:hypothetical protein QBC38DRAFT_532067 [Podospora fimiseda]
MSSPTSPSSPFILRQVFPSDLQSLCRYLWDWSICTPCQLESKLHFDSTFPPIMKNLCAAQCPWTLKSARYHPFFDWYKQVTSSYAPDLFGENCQALRHHQDLHRLIGRLRGHDKFVHDQNEYQKDVPFWGQEVPESDKIRALKLARKVMTMSDVYSVDLRGECEGERWMESFQVRQHPCLKAGTEEGERIREMVSGDKLVGIAGLRIKGTDELQNHLRLDDEKGEVLVFGWTTVLSTGLLATLPEGGCFPDLGELVIEEMGIFRRDGECIPRALALETMQTISLLFPPSNRAAQKLLRSLVDRKVLPDPNILRFGTTSYILSKAERDRALQLPIWGSRLLDLYDEVENPRPRGRVESWLERRSKSRHVMMATIVGIGAAVVLGVLGLGVAIFQTW